MSDKILKLVPMECRNAFIEAARRDAELDAGDLRERTIVNEDGEVLASARGRAAARKFVKSYCELHGLPLNALKVTPEV